MTDQISDSLHRLKAASKRVVQAPWQKEPSLANGCSEDELAEFRDQWGELPADYMEYLRRCRRIVAMDVFNGYELYSPLKAGGMVRRVLWPVGGVAFETRVIVVGGDGGGNSFLLGIPDSRQEHADELGGVWKLQHEWSHAVKGGRVDVGLTLVASTFGGFLARIALDWEKFADGEPDWPYLAG